MAKNKKWPLVAAISAAVLLASAALLIVNAKQVLGMFGIIQKPPVFVFNQEKAPAWWAAKNYSAQAHVDDYKGDTPIEKLPIASMGVFKGKEGDGRTDCFVSFSYYTYKQDISKLKAEKDAGMPHGDLSMNPIGITKATVNIFGENKMLTMNNYELSGPGSETSMKGMSYGWIELSDGYVEVDGVCPTGRQLSEVPDASTAISLISQ